MRIIPYPVVAILALAVVAGFWWARTRHMDFMVSRGGVAKPLPSFIAPVGDESDPSSLPDPTSRPATSEGGDEVGPKEPEPDPLRLGDLESAPGLGEYSELASLGAAHLILAAEELENRGNFPRAHLAWERVIDTCDPTPEERSKVGDALQRIRPTLPRWNIDPSGEYPLLLQLGTTRTTDTALSLVTTDVADFLHKESSDLVAIVPHITTSRVRGTPQQSPIALYFSGTGEDEKNQSELTSINPPTNEPETLRLEMLAALYTLVQQRVAGLDTLTPPAPAAHPERPEIDFERNLTRLHWQYFARSLTQTPGPPASPEKVERSDLEEDADGETPD